MEKEIWRKRNRVGEEKRREEGVKREWEGKGLGEGQRG